MDTFSSSLCNVWSVETHIHVFLCFLNWLSADAIPGQLSLIMWLRKMPHCYWLRAGQLIVNFKSFLSANKRTRVRCHFQPVNKWVIIWKHVQLRIYITVILENYFKLHRPKRLCSFERILIRNLISLKICQVFSVTINSTFCEVGGLERQTILEPLPIPVKFDQGWGSVPARVMSLWLSSS